MEYGKRLTIEQDDDGGFVYDGAHTATASGAFYYGLMNFCGCGCPDEALALTRACLDGPPRDYKPDVPAPLRHDQVSALIAQDPDRAAWFVMYALDAWQFTEHGGSIGGSWLTDRGIQAVEVFKNDNDNPDGDEN